MSTTTLTSVSVIPPSQPGVLSFNPTRPRAVWIKFNEGTPGFFVTGVITTDGAGLSLSDLGITSELFGDEITLFVYSGSLVLVSADGIETPVLENKVAVCDASGGLFTDTVNFPANVEYVQVNVAHSTGMQIMCTGRTCPPR